MDKWLKQRAELIKSAKSLIDARKSADQNLSDDDRAHLEKLSNQVEEIDALIEGGRKDAALLEHFKGRRPGPKLSGAGDDPEVVGLELKSISPAGIRSMAHKFAQQATDGSKSFEMLSAGGTSAMLVELAALPQAPNSLLEVIPQRKLVSPPQFRFLQQRVRANNAAPVAPGDTKPTTPISIEPIESSLRVIAHMSEPVDKYIWSDVVGLAGFVQGELQYGLYQALEAQALNGNGTAPNLHGILGTSGLLNQPFSTDISRSVRAAITKLETAGYTPAAVAMSPADWESVETSVTTGSGEFVLPNSPVDRANQKLWGVRVVLSNALPAKTALLLGQDTCWIGTDGIVALDIDKSTGFDKNQIRFRLEGRWETAVTRPSGIAKVATAAA
ncbi:phage major capsid protein [Jongsikchunia kroppenstedtii]|uniref:phage major capsid protein n=1 Tax=Jongsikchunia kroppenstedtii TaxID=1121721 RepID=UPI00036AED41|nr:phage major capsid protein [Jongsikchunia kroppenstedtii]